MSEAVIKQVPEDFIVRERARLILNPSGRFAYYRLSKRGYSTQKAVETVARAFHKRLKYVNFAGNKDKHAVTEQSISILHGPARSLEREGIKLEFLGRGRERINLGDLEGNEFEITVRNIGKGPDKPKCVPNYYDTQRFGMKLDNHKTGKLIVQKGYREACKRIPETGERLGKDPRDFVGALRALPKRVLRIYPHAYQAFLWNRIASEYLKGFPSRIIKSPLGELTIPKEKIKNIGIPVPGHGMEKTGNRKLDSIIGKVLKEEGLEKGDFSQKQFPEFDLKGGERDLLANLKDLKIGEIEKDELNPGRKKCLVKFFLGSGSYATMVLRVMFSGIGDKKGEQSVV
jgi:tRNA pseudouridine13 synthase